MQKFTIKELKEIAKKVSPGSLKEVKANKYKVDGFDGYLLLDDVTKDNKVPQLFYHGKWRQDDLSILHDVIITKDNIHLYYEFMSDEDIKKYSNILLSIIDYRFFRVVEILKLEKNSIGNFNNVDLFGFFDKKLQKLNSTYGTIVLRYSIFGTKDTLKPIDEYIAAIKDSEDYKEYIYNSTLESMSKDQLVEMVEEFEYYPSVTKDDDKGLILAYLSDEACNISKDEIMQYISKSQGV